MEFKLLLKTNFSVFSRMTLIPLLFGVTRQCLLFGKVLINSMILDSPIPNIDFVNHLLSFHLVSLDYQHLINLQFILTTGDSFLFHGRLTPSLRSYHLQGKEFGLHASIWVIFTTDRLSNTLPKFHNGFFIEWSYFSVPTITKRIGFFFTVIFYTSLKIAL